MMLKIKIPGLELNKNSSWLNEQGLSTNGLSAGPMEDTHINKENITVPLVKIVHLEDLLLNHVLGNIISFIEHFIKWYFQLIW